MMITINYYIMPNNNNLIQVQEYQMSQIGELLLVKFKLDIT